MTDKGANALTEEDIASALLLDTRGGATTVKASDLEQWAPEQGYLWLHLDYTLPGVQAWLENESGLNDIAYSALLSEETRPRTIHRGDRLLLALRGVNLNPGEDPEDMVSVRIWTDGKRLISTSRRDLVSIHDIREQLESGSGPTNIADLLVGLNDKLVDRMGDIVEDMDDKVASQEEKLLAGDTDGLSQSLTQLRKQVVMLRRYFAPQREAMNRLAAENVSWMDEMNKLRLREIGDRLIRHIEDIDEIREHTTLAQEELLSAVSEEMNQRTYVLTIVAAIFLPLGFFTGLMGINVGGMPGMQSHEAFWIVTGLCAVVVVILLVLFRMKRWL